MSMNNDRLSDDSIFSPAHATRPEPQFATSLVTRLGLSRSSNAEKERGIARWLDGHTPSVRLKNSLIKSGYGHLLHLNA